MLHDPDAKLDYGCDWSAWLADGETITDSKWIVPDGLTGDDASHDDTTTVVWITGGTAGQRYPLTNRVTTSEGRIDDRTITLVCQNR